MKRSLLPCRSFARYSGRTLEAYRHDLRWYFQWATNHGVAVMEASRAHIELFRAWMEDRGLAASTIDRRLSTVCGFYRFAHIDGRIHSNPAQYVLPISTYRARTGPAPRSPRSLRLSHSSRRCSQGSDVDRRSPVP